MTVCEGVHNEGRRNTVLPETTAFKDISVSANRMAGNLNNLAKDVLC
jgi:hypothetical protein